MSARCPACCLPAVAGTNTLSYALVQPATDLTYGLGDGAGNGFGGDLTPGTARGEFWTAGGAGILGTSASGLVSPVTVTGTPGGTLTIVGDGEDQLLEVIDAEAAGVGGPANFTRVLAYNEDVDGTFAAPGCRRTPTWTLRRGRFPGLALQGAGGNDVVDVVSFDAAESGADDADAWPAATATTC